MFHSFRASSSSVTILVTIRVGPEGGHPWVSWLEIYTCTLVSQIDSMTEASL